MNDKIKCFERGRRLMEVLLLVLFMLAVGAVLNTHAQPGTEPEPGVPRALARWRAEYYSNVRYQLKIELVPGAPMIIGEVEIRVLVAEGASNIVLDWRINPVKEGQPKPRVWDISLNGNNTVQTREINEHLVINGAIKGENVIRLRFESPIATSGSAVTRYIDREDKSEYIYTLFVPSDASTAFPCFDQPDLKVRFFLSVTAPEEWIVVSNTNAQVKLVPQDETSSGVRHAAGQPKTMTTVFGTTEPISTYVFAFAAGPFTVIEQFPGDVGHTAEYPKPRDMPAKNGVTTMKLFVRKSKEQQARKEAEEVFRLNLECLKFFVKYFEYKFPFSKYDLIIIPEFAYRGMEHAGATFLREESILFPTEPTANDFLSRANVIFHEAAHQWFGDLVTMEWFDDLWLKEGFAEFMSFKAVEAIMPEFNAWKAFYERTKPAAYLTDATRGTTPIFQEIPNLSAAKSAYGNIVYRKAPSILRQAEFYLGPANFQKAVQLFLKEHSYTNASWSDLVRAFERTSQLKLDTWAAAWVKRRGMPEISVHRVSGPTEHVQRVTLVQKDVLDEGGMWPMRIGVYFVLENAPPITRILVLDGKTTTSVTSIPTNGHRLLYVFANYQDYGYGRFPIDEKSRDYVLKRIVMEKDDFQRALLWGSLWDSVREAELSPLAYIELAIRNIDTEDDEVTVLTILNRVSFAFNNYLSREQANGIASRLESMLLTSMAYAKTPGLRLTYFRAFQTTALLPEAHAGLKKFLNGEFKVKGVQLRPRDRFDILTVLMARGDPEAPALLEAMSKEASTDDTKRYAFAAGAAWGTAENKKKYFDAYLHDPNLAESWIDASVGPFNSIHQSALTLPYLESALKELPKLKRTRKIFFVNGWLAAFIGGQTDKRALDIVNDFLKREENSLDRDLRLKVLEVVDGLERCVKIRAKYAIK